MWEMASWVFPALALFMAIIAYVGTSIWNSYRYLAEVYYEILKIGVEHPEFLDPEKTRKYKYVWGSDPEKFFSYGAYAQICWSHAEDIYDAKFSEIFLLRKLYAPTLGEYKKLHGVWLRDNASMFPMKGFREFVISFKYRDYYPDDDGIVAKLTWGGEFY